MSHLQMIYKLQLGEFNFVVMFLGMIESEMKEDIFTTLITSRTITWGGRRGRKKQHCIMIPPVKKLTIPTQTQPNSGA